MAVARGRPRDAHIDRAVLQVAADVLAEDGYRGVVIEEVARRSGVSKAAVYRRWSNRRHLVLAVLQDRVAQVAAPDTGCTLCDLHECLTLVTGAFERLGAGVLAQLIADGGDDPDLRRQLEEAVLEPPRRAVHRTLYEARRRGDLDPELDLGMTVDALSALVFYRLLLGATPMSSAEIEAVVLTVLRGIARDADALLREYREHDEHDESDG